jgi:hypothetical protein
MGRAFIHFLMAAIGLSAVVEPPLVIAGSRLAMGLKAQMWVNGWIEGWEHYSSCSAYGWLPVSVHNGD